MLPSPPYFRACPAQMSPWSPHAGGPSSRGTYPGAVPGAQPHQGAQGCQHQVSLGRVKQPRQQPHTITLEDFFCSSLLSCQHNQVLSRLGEERHVWVTHPPEQTPCTQGTSCGSPWGSHRHPDPLPVSKERVLLAESLGSQDSTAQQCRPGHDSSTPCPTPKSRCPPFPGVQTFCFLSASFSSGSSKIWNICSTFESVQDMVFI